MWLASRIEGFGMGDRDELAGRFEANRPRLRAVAYRMLGSLAEADDAVQEAWLRLGRAGADGVDNLDAWLTTVVGRVCLDMLRSRTSRKEAVWDATATEPAAAADTDPEGEALLADSVGLALLVVLETLTPTERLAFVLHDLFGVPFDEIAPIVGRSPDAARQLASRARRRVRENPPAAGQGAQRRIVDAFLDAARGGEIATLLTLLDPDVEMRVDGAAAHQGSQTVARFFAGRAQAARPALLDGVLGVVVVPDGQVRVVMWLTVAGGRITGIESVTEPSRISSVAVIPLE
jgi:RNA polymerase sigma-70 factor (ECF subfamily)